MYLSKICSTHFLDHNIPKLVNHVTEIMTVVYSTKWAQIPKLIPFVWWIVTGLSLCISCLTSGH